MAATATVRNNLRWSNPGQRNLRQSNLGQTICNTPVAGYLPGLNAVIASLNPDFVLLLAPILRAFGARRLNRAQLIRAARHQHALFPVPVPVIAEAGMRHWVCRRPKFGIPPAPAAVERYLHAADGA